MGGHVLYRQANSTELSEAINSMFRYYAESEVCYAYLADVPDDDDVSHRYSKFRTSRWFTRGWTLQELLAPKKVLFYSKDWKFLGSRSDLKEVVSSITRIPEEVLDSGDCQPPNRSIGEVMSWASRRNTTVLEDIAYCLLGLLDISMPLLYGEGERAFLRLQEELLKRYDDESLFAWEAPPNDALTKPYFGLLSPSITYFEASHHFRNPTTRTRLNESNPRFITSKGISLSFPRIPVDETNDLYYGLLDCRVHGTHIGEVQPAIQVNRLSGDQYARVDVHHLHQVRFDRLINNIDMFFANCPMVFPANPQPPRPITGFVVHKEYILPLIWNGRPGHWGHGGIRVVDHYSPSGWSDVGPERLILNINNAHDASSPLAGPQIEPLGILKVQRFMKPTSGNITTYGTTYVVVGVETRKGNLPGPQKKTEAWGFFMERPGMTAATAFQHIPSHLLLSRPTQLETEFPQYTDRKYHLEIKIVEREYPGRVLYKIDLGSSKVTFEPQIRQS